jgi:hypothetical protein
MASQAQIDANKRNAEEATGPKTEGGKARARLNALNDSTHAKIVKLVLPQENPVDLDERINQWLSDLNPQNDVERELVTRAAKLPWRGSSRPGPLSRRRRPQPECSPSAHRMG